MASTTGFLVFLSAAYWTWAIIDLFTADRSEVRRYDKLTWLFFITFVPVFGPLSWCLTGRPKHTAISPSPLSPSAISQSPLPPSEDLHAEAKEDTPFVDVGQPLGPEDDEAWMANLTADLVNHPASSDGPPNDSLVLEAADDFAAWEADL